MTLDIRSHLLRAAKSIPALFLALLAVPVLADGLEAALRHGENGGHYEVTGVALRLGPWWSKEWGDWAATLRPELELNHFRYTGPASGSSTLNEGGGIALFRFQYVAGRFRPYAEIGLGAALFSSVQLGNKDFSTSYQFSEHVGLGAEFAGRWFAGWRFSHYSNATIKLPNDGIDMHQLVIGVRF